MLCNGVKFSWNVGYRKKIPDETGGLCKETFRQSIRGAVWFLFAAYSKIEEEREAKGKPVNNTKRSWNLLFLRILSLPQWQIMLKLKNDL